MVPEGWKICTLGDLGKWGGGGTPSKSKPEFWLNGTIPWISPKDMGRPYIDDAEDYITAAAVEQSSTKVYPSGSVLVVTRSGILRKKLPVAVATRDVAVNQDLKVLVTDSHNSHEYVANFLWCYNDSLLSNCAKDGTTVESIDTGSLLSFSIKLPPLPEQKKIAQILSTWDQAITATERLLENSQQRKKGLMQQLLTGKKRLPGFEGEWEEGSLGDIAVIDSGFSFKSNDFSDSKDAVPIIRMSDFKSGGLDTRNAAHVTEDTLDGLDKFALRSEDFVFGMSGSLSNYAWIRPTDLPCYLNQRVGRIRAKKEANQFFVTYLFLSDRVQQNILDKAAGAAQLNISVKDLRELRITYPSKEEQNEIAHILFVANQDISELGARLNCLKQEKKALMQQLLTGKRRVQVEAA